MVLVEGQQPHQLARGLTERLELSSGVQGVAPTAQRFSANY